MPLIVRFLSSGKSVSLIAAVIALLNPCLEPLTKVHATELRPFPFEETNPATVPQPLHLPQSEGIEERKTMNAKLSVQYSAFLTAFFASPSPSAFPSYWCLLPKVVSGQSRGLIIPCRFDLPAYFATRFESRVESPTETICAG